MIEIVGVITEIWWSSPRRAEFSEEEEVYYAYFVVDYSPASSHSLLLCFMRPRDSFAKMDGKRTKKCLKKIVFLLHLRYPSWNIEKLRYNVQFLLSGTLRLFFSCGSAARHALFER